MTTDQWLIVIGILTLTVASLGLYNSLVANLRTGRLHQFMEHIESRVILLERDVHRHLMKDGVEHADLPFLHDIRPTFKEVEQQMQEIYRRAKS